MHVWTGRICTSNFVHVYTPRVCSIISLSIVLKLGISHHMRGSRKYYKFAEEGAHSTSIEFASKILSIEFVSKIRRICWLQSTLILFRCSVCVHVCVHIVM